MNKRNPHPKTVSGRPRKHGGLAFMRTGLIPKGKEFIGKLAESVCEEIVSDLGGPKVITATQALLIHEIRKLITFQLLIDEWLAQQGGILDGSGEPLPPLNAFYLSTVNAIKRFCELIGFRRADRGSLVLSDYIKQHDARRAKEISASRKANAQEAQGATIIPPLDQGHGKEGESQAVPAALEDGAMGEGDPGSEDAT